MSSLEAEGRRLPCSRDRQLRAPCGRSELTRASPEAALRSSGRAIVFLEDWRRPYNRVRPHSALGYRPPAPETLPMAKSQINSGAGATVMGH
ncbi:integrase core domain-containing protein [Falsiroseomonas selenitidurans]|uniref:integrase core domain-containing protein n=1 Tax=Falsiroseomonas selenitidurans TaxID=2716335 RepID=UPI0038B235F3